MPICRMLTKYSYIFEKDEELYFGKIKKCNFSEVKRNTVAED